MIQINVDEDKLQKVTDRYNAKANTDVTMQGMAEIILNRAIKSLYAEYEEHEKRTFMDAYMKAPPNTRAQVNAALKVKHG